MTASSRVAGYLWLGALGLLAGLLLGRVEPVVLAAPFLLVLVVAVALARVPRLSATFTLDRERAIEGDEVEATLTVASDHPVERLEVQLARPRGLVLLDDPASLVLGLPRGGERELHLRLACRRWGGFAVGHLRLVARDRFGLFRWEQVLDLRRPLKVYPAAEEVRRLLKPARTQAFAGNQVARAKGEGIEFADIRAFSPGDLVRRVNWRVTARRGALHVNEFHLERNADVVIFLDTFTEVRDVAGGSLDQAVRGAAALIQGHLRERDRVGLVGFGGTLRWLRPAMGEVQLYRLVDSLIDTEIVLSYAWKGLEVIPRRTLPPGSMVVAFTPLLDERTLRALSDLSGRGHDVAVVEIPPADWLRPGTRESERIAFRLWEMDREALRARFQQLGVAVATWPRGGGLADALEEVRGFRRQARLVRA
ncbi:MAG TPA: DUF58 domain-containing protein [Candidatus Dormibacteraeota bacterium]